MIKKRSWQSIIEWNTTNIIFSLFNHDFQVTCSFLPKPAYSQPFIFNLSGLVCLVFGTRIYKTPHLTPHQVSNTVRAELQQITADAAGPRMSIASDEDAWGGLRRSRKTNHSCERSECQSRVRGGPRLIASVLHYITSRNAYRNAPLWTEYLFPRPSNREEPLEGWKWWTHGGKVTTRFHFTELPPEEDA